ncbi:MAG: DinB family protein [Planctomycetota bacterium]|nr:DinB family protein [Planctomycetota bacterium]
MPKNSPPLAARLSKDLREVMKFFAKPKAVQRRAYAPGKWTMREILVHLSDTEAVLLDRLRRMTADAKPVLQAFDQDRWAAKLSYTKRDLKLAARQYQAAREGILETLKLLGPKAKSLRGRHTENGAVSGVRALWIIEYHTAHHLEQLRAIAAGKIWTPKAK